MTWQILSRKLKFYILFLTVAAIPIVASAVWDLQHTHYDRGWIVLTILTVLTVPFFHLLPSVWTIIGIGDAYVMAIAMMYGTSPCILATLCHTVAGSLFVPNRPKIYPYRVVFNISSTLCGAWIYSNIYHLMNSDHSTRVPDIILPAAVLTLAFFLFNSLSTATAIALASGQKIFSFWSQNYLPLGVDFSVSAVCATMIVSFYEGNHLIPLGVAPLIGVVWGWNKINKAKAMEAEKHLKEQEQLYLRTVESLALAVDAKDQTTYGHIRRVRSYAMGLAKLCGISNSGELMAIETGSLLHDIGKLAIDDYILNKPGKLSKEEFEKMKLHTAAGDEILQLIQYPFPVAKYVRSHHERWDGTGYPDGLRGEEIPLGARILAIADAFDAIRSSRPYKLSFGIQDSIELLRAQAGTTYDAKLVDLFIQHIDELEAKAVEAGRNMSELSFRKYFEKVNLALSSSNVTATPPPVTPNVSSELVSLNEFCNSIGRHLDLTDILVLLARRLRRLLPFSTCAFYLDNGDATLRAAHVSGQFCDILQNLTIGLGKGISGWSAAYQRPILNTGPALEFQELEGDFTCLTDALVVPLIHEEECLGTISLYAQAPAFYSQSHLGMLQVVASQVAPLIGEVRRRKISSSELDLIDPITRTYRPSYLSVAGSQMIATAEQSKSPFSILYLEVKNLSQLVSIFGTPARDSILLRVAEILRAELRETDVLVRFGLEGFVALMVGVREDQAARCAQRLHQRICNNPPGNVTGQNAELLCQIGIATYPNDGRTIFSLLESAQHFLVERLKSTSVSADEASGNLLEFPPRA